VGRWTVLESIALADCAFDVEGRDLDDLFATAARALVDLMIDPATLPPTLTREVTLGAPSLDLLLFDWLAELIYLKDAESLAFPAVEVSVSGGPPARLVARLHGGVIDRERTALRADPKAVTFHQFALEPGGLGWRARIVIDI
jgi:SHS2 domain-containing protein